MKEMEEILQKTKGEYSTVETDENELRSKEVDLKHEVEKLEAIYKENHQKVRHWQKEVRLHIVIPTHLLQSDSTHFMHEHIVDDY